MIGLFLPITLAIVSTNSRYVNVSGPIASIILFSVPWPCSTASFAKSST